MLEQRSMEAAFKTPGAEPEASEPTDLMGRLRSETRDEHFAVEGTILSERMMAGRLDLESYRQLLSCYLFIHRRLDASLNASILPVIADVFCDYQRKCSLLQRDLDAIGSPVADSAAQPLAAFAAWFSERESRIDLLGVLYVMEGSTLGGLVLRKRVSAALGLELDAPGLLYYGAYGQETARRWAQFKLRMNALSLPKADEDAIIASAREMFDHIGACLRAIGGD